MFILLLILILSTSLFTFNAATSSVTESMNNLNSIEIQAFNEPIVQYEGRQMGSQVKSLLGTLITNAGNNKDSNERLPDIKYVPGEGPTVDSNLKSIISNVKNTKINEMNKLKSKIANSHYYTVEFTYDDATGLVKSVTITY